MASNNWEVETLQYIVARIVENARDAESAADDFSKGKRMAYYEVLDTIKTELAIMGADPEVFGIDFDLEGLLK